MMYSNKQEYVAPEMMVIDNVCEGAICTYSLIYPGEGGPVPPAARRGYHGESDSSNGRYGRSTTQIWN